MQKTDNQNQNLLGILQNFLQEHSPERDLSINIMEDLDQNQSFYMNDLIEFKNFISKHIEKFQNDINCDQQIRDLYKNCQNFYLINSSIGKCNKLPSQEEEEKKEDFDSIEKEKLKEQIKIKDEFVRFCKECDFESIVQKQTDLESDATKIFEESRDQILNDNFKEIQHLTDIGSKIRKNIIQKYEESNLKQMVIKYKQWQQTLLDSNNQTNDYDESLLINLLKENIEEFKEQDDNQLKLMVKEMKEKGYQSTLYCQFIQDRDRVDKIIYETHLKSPFLNLKTNKVCQFYFLSLGISETESQDLIDSYFFKLPNCQMNEEQIERLKLIEQHIQENQLVRDYIEKILNLSIRNEIQLQFSNIQINDQFLKEKLINSECSEDQFQKLINQYQLDKTHPNFQIFEDIYKENTLKSLYLKSLLLLELNKQDSDKKIYFSQVYQFLCDVKLKGIDLFQDDNYKSLIEMLKIDEKIINSEKLQNLENYYIQLLLFACSHNDETKLKLISFILKKVLLKHQLESEQIQYLSKQILKTGLKFIYQLNDQEYNRTNNKSKIDIEEKLKKSELLKKVYGGDLYEIQDKSVCFYLDFDKQFELQNKLDKLFQVSQKIDINQLLNYHNSQEKTTSIKNWVEEIADLYISGDLSFSQRLFDLLIYLSKRNQNLDSIYKDIQDNIKLKKQEKDDKILINKKTVPEYMMQSSDSESMFKLTIMLGFANPVPLLITRIVPPSQNNSYKLQQELFYQSFWLINQFDKVVASIGVGFQKGKSTLINNTFITNFAISDGTYSFMQSAEIQSNSIFQQNKRQYFLADFHGDASLLNEQYILGFFVYYIIQVNASIFKNKQTESLLKIIKLLEENDKKFCILIRDYDEKINASQYKDIKLASEKLEYPDLKKYDTILLNNFCNIYQQDLDLHCNQLRIVINDLIIKNLGQQNSRDLFINRFFSQFQKQPDQIYNNFNKELEQKGEEIAAAAQIYYSYQLVQNVCNQLKNQKQLESQNIFKLYNVFSEYQKIKMEFNHGKFQSMSQKQVSERNSQYESKYFEYKKSQIEDKSELVKQFEQLVIDNNKNHYMSMLFFIQQLRDVNNYYINQLKNKKIVLQQSQTIQQNDISKQIYEIEKQILDESISVELFWREVIQHWYKSNNSSLNEKLIEAYSLNIYNGFPFEIIDGETFYYPYEFLKKCFSHQLFTNKKFCIISIIGPQNSGKSTLLNYFLGCDFYVSEGRCTRGIYGTLVKSKVPQFDYILVIDSEGLLSQEKKDPDYDRKLTLFCLSVSQFLIINVKELTTEISNILELCIDVSTDLKTNKIPKKVVEIVFNQKGDPNNQNNCVAVENALKNFQDKKKIIDHIDIKSKNVTNLPTAFSYKHKVVQNDQVWNFLETQINFVEGVQKLGDKIIDKLINLCQEDEKQAFRLVKTIPEFLELMNNIYETINQNQDLTAFRDILQKQNDKRIKEFMKKKMNDEIDETFLKEIDSITQNNQIKNVDSQIKDLFDCLEQKIKKKMQEEFQIEQELLNKNFDYLHLKLQTLLENTINDIEFGKQIKNLEEFINKKTLELLSQAEQQKNNSQEEQIEYFEEKLHEIEQIVQKNSQLNNIDVLFSFIKDNYELQLGKQFTTKIIQNYQFDFDLQETLHKKTSLIHFLETKDHLLNCQKKDNEIINHQLLQQIYEIFYIRLDYLKKYLDFTSNQIKPNFLKNACNITINKKNLNSILFEDLYKYIDMNFELKDIISKEKEQKRINQISFQTQSSIYTFKEHQIEQKTNIFDDQSKNLIELKLKDITNNVLSQWLKTQLQANFNCNILKIDSYFSRINQKINQAINNRTNVDRQLISEVANIVQDEIKQSQEQLRFYQIQLSEISIHFLNNMAIQELYKFQLQNQQNKLNNIIDQNFSADKKQSLKGKFLENAKDKDKQLLNEFIQNLQMLSKRYLDSNSKIVINKNLEIYKDSLSKEDIVKEIQQKIYQKQDFSLDQIDTYLEDPNKVIIDTALSKQNEFVKYVSYQLSEIQNELFKTLKAILNQTNQTIEFLMGEEQIKNNETPKLFIDNIFQILSNKQVNIDQNTFDQAYSLQLKNQKDIQFFKEFWDITQQSSFYSIEQIKLIFSQLKITIQDKIFQEEIIKAYAVDLIDKEFSNITQYLSCNSKCPCCGQPCDQDHWKYLYDRIGTGENKHTAKNGHRFAAFNGVKIEQENLPALIMCSDYDDETQFKYKQTQLKWSNFKKMNDDWDWNKEVQNQKLQLQRLTYQKIWSIVGQKICNKNNIQYQEICDASIIKKCKSQINPVHFIIVFDESGSMEGEKWITLRKELLNFIDNRSRATAQDFITLIGFAHTVKLYTKVEKLNEQIKQKVPQEFMDGGTNYSAPLQQALNILSQEQCQTFKKNNVIFFLSDGDAKEPKTEIQQLQKLGHLIKLIQFVGYGDENFQTLKSMANDLQNVEASYSNVINIDTLQDELKYLSLIIPS